MTKYTRIPHYSCEQGLCAEDEIYPANMLREYEGQLWCEDCWVYDNPLTFAEDERPSWGDLDAFIPEAWISVEDKLPAESIPCLVTVKGNVYIGFYFSRTKQFDTYREEFTEVTHWMGLPELPTQD